MEKIKVTQINQNISRSSVPYQLLLGLKNEDIEMTTITAVSEVKDSSIVIVKKNLINKLVNKIVSLFIKLEKKYCYGQSMDTPFSYYKIGVTINKKKEIIEADIIHLHWICGEFLSMNELKKITKLGKPIVWNCHDNWPFTGGCHVRLGCEKYKEHCGYCPQLKSQIKKDWSFCLLERKKRVLKGTNLTVVSPSTWMDRNVQESSLFRKFPHYIIPNPIDVNIFKKLNRNEMRKKYGIDNQSVILLFGAVKATNTPYKGYDYLLEALDILEVELNGNSQIEAIVFGTDQGDSREKKKIKIRYLGYLNREQMAEIYNCADVYVVPSLEDSFNSTVAESMSCETPVVAFSTGGIVDIIDHKHNGYLAAYKDSKDLAKGIIWILEHKDSSNLGTNGRKKVEEQSSVAVISKQYRDLYCSLIK